MRIADPAVISSDCFDTAVVFSAKINLDRVFECKTVCMMPAQVKNCKKTSIKHAQIQL